ncbi:MAG: hypothetical protein Q8858_09225 [Bacteroidota bacterium]|nr:hypothetical protein [Bacteroidota bacterium]
MKTIRFLILLFLASNIVSAENDEASFSKISAILFPETSSWTLVSNMKHADSAFLRNNEAKLRKAYLSSKLINNPGDISCSFIDRVFSADYDFPKYFYIHDIDHDGIEDILYTGMSPCSEGNATVIWFGTPQGFEIRQDYFWYALAIRISEGNNLQISSVAVGCCGETIDDYMCGRIINLRCDGMKRFYHTTELPPLTEQSGKTVESFVSKKELTLRSAPEINDNYIDGFSQYLGKAVFGNILSKYMTGCKGEIIENIADKNSRKWYFVVINNESKALRTHMPYDVCAGWISSDNISKE